MIQRKLAILLGAAALAMSAPASATIHEYKVDLTFASTNFFTGIIGFDDSTFSATGLWTLFSVDGVLDVSNSPLDMTSATSIDFKGIGGQENLSTGPGNFSQYLVDNPNDVAFSILFGYNYNPNSSTPLTFTYGSSWHTLEINGVNYDNYLIEDPVLSGSITAVPEPETYAMVLAGLGLISMMTRRRRA